MKKKMMGIIAIVAVAAVTGYNVYTSQKNVKLSDLALANIEALASSGEGFQSDCNTYCMTSYFDTCIIRYTNNTFTTCYDSRIRR
jgi:hypothetical protein